MSPRPKTLGFTPASSVAGVLRPPGSKSVAQRALLAAALARPSVEAGPSRLEDLPDGEDVRAAVRLAQGLGAELLANEAGVAILNGVGPRACRGTRVSAGESGTLARLTTAVLALHAPRGVRLEVAGSLAGRRSEPLVEALRRAGARLERVLDLPRQGQGARGEPAGTWPLAITAAETAAPAELRLENPVSSQEVSALWLAAAGLEGTTTVRVDGDIPSRPYLAITRRVLTAFGADLEGEPASMRVTGPLRATDLAIEADASSAAVALAAACLSGGDALRVTGIPADSAQGDVRILEYLERFGCSTQRGGDSLRISGVPTRGVELDLVNEPDLAPVLAAVAAGAAQRAGATSVLRGLGTLRGKESDRIAALSDGLRRCGFAVEATDVSLTIGPGAGGPIAQQVLLDPRGDHRMAFAFALLGLVRAGVVSKDPGCVAKSWPGFWEDLERIGARVQRST